MVKGIIGIVLLALLTGLGSCRDTPGEDAVRARMTTIKGVAPLTGDCNCYFAASLRDFEAEKYLVATDLDSVAYISLNNRLIKLKLASSSALSGDSGAADYRNTYTDGLYTLVISVRFKEHTADEAWWNTGIIRVLFKNIEIANREVVGECGC